MPPKVYIAIKTIVITAAGRLTSDEKLWTARRAVRSMTAEPVITRHFFFIEISIRPMDARQAHIK